MSSANSTLRVTELDFNGIKNNLKTFLRAQSEFQDYDFEGSGMSVLLDILAYNSHYMGYYLNVTANEMFLDTAQLRQSVLSHAKLIGYVPGSVRSSKASVTITVTPSTVEDNDLNILTLDKYTKFAGQPIDGASYNFLTTYSNTAFKSNGSFVFNNINLIQGEPVTIQYLVDDNSNPKRRYTIPNANVDISTISISVQESSSNTYTTQYKLATDITEITSESNIFFVEENEELSYTFYFGDGVIGKKPVNGNIVVCTYVDSVGDNADNISVFALASPGGIGNLYRDNVRIVSANSSFAGSSKETIEQIRFRAPYHYTTQNRAVTTLDYETLITKDYPNVESVSVWGGEDNDPIVYGKVYLSLKTKDNLVLSNFEKDNIKNELIKNRNVLTIIPEIIDPDYVYISIRGSVNYNPGLTSLSSNEISQRVRAAVVDYTERELNKFNSTFRKSKFQYYIETADNSITGSDITVYLQKRLPVTLNETKNYLLKYNMPLKKGDFNTKLESFPQFTVNDNDGISRNVFIEEIPQSFTGVDSIAMINPGKNYIESPTVTITGDGIGASARAVIVNGRVDRIIIIDKGSNYTRASVSITGGGGSEASAAVRLEARFGNLRTFYFKTNGEKVIVNTNVGSIDYDTGSILINSLLTSNLIANSLYEENILSLIVPTENEIIRPLRNRILTLDFNDPSAIQIDIVVE
jgi:hypothetical protein